MAIVKPTLGLPNPPAGWVRMPQNEPRGGPWEAVPDDSFEGQVYYRQRLPNPEITPENFTVLVGNQWVATMMTKEYGEIAFYADLRDQLPPVLNAIAPYRLLWKAIMGDTETAIGALEHESFHAFQGTLAPLRLAEAEAANRSESDYPWDNTALDEAWKRETGLLVQAIRTSSNEEAMELVRQFLAHVTTMPESDVTHRVNASLTNDQLNALFDVAWPEHIWRVTVATMGSLTI